MRPTHNPKSSNALSLTASSRHLPERLRRLAAKLAGVLDARLLLTLAALAIVASVLAVTAHMQGRVSQQKAKVLVSTAVVQDEKRPQRDAKPLPIDDSFRAPAPPDTSGKLGTQPIEVTQESDGQTTDANQPGPSLSGINEKDLFSPEPKAVTATTYAATVASGVALDTMTGSTQLLAASLDDTASAVTNIGFDFWFDGVRYTQFSANANGLMRLGGTVVDNSTNGRTNNLATANDNPKIAAYWDDQCTSSTGQVHYLVTATAPNRKLTVEFQNMRTYNAGCTTGTLLGNYQVWIYESSRSTLPGVVAFVYGTIPVNPNVGGGYTVGIASSSASFASITTVTPSVSYAVSNNSQLTAITSGTEYIFTPNTPVAPTGLSFTNVAPTSMTLNWTDNATNEFGYVVYNSTDGTNYNFLGQIAANSTGANVSGLTSNTNYFWKVYAVTEGALSSALSGTQATSVAVPINGTRTVCPSGCNYATLTAAIADLTANGVNGAVTLELQSTYFSTSETFPIAIGNISGNSATNTITVRPATGATNLSITSANTTATIDLNGAKNIIFDGQPGGTGGTKQLTIEDTSLSGVAIRFINDASNDKIQYCTVKGVNSSVSGGVIFFSTTTGTTGNDNNTIDNCDVRDGATTPTNLIYSQGTQTTTALNNSGNTISNNNISNFFAATVASNGILVSVGSTDWTISGNSIYQTATRTSTAGSTHTAINIGNTTSGNNFSVTNNKIGGDSPNAAVTTQKWTISGAFANVFNGINLSVGTTTASSVQGNTIANVSVLSTSTASAGYFVGINVGNGNVNVGTTTGNTIGATTGTGNIVLSQSTSNGGAGYGINAGSSNTVSISNNNIGSINLTTSSNTLTTNFTGIRVVTGTYTISANTIGSTTTANSINSDGGKNTTTNASSIRGISQEAIGSVAITNNTIANLAYSATGGTGPSTGITVYGIAVSAGTNTVSGNTIRNLSSTSGNTGTTSSAAVAGILMNSSSATQTVSQNTVHSLSNTHATAAVNLYGIYYAGSTSGTNIIERNFVHSLSTTSTGAAVINGIYTFNGSSTFKNNMVRLGIDAAGASVTSGALVLNGILSDTVGGATNNYYFNSVFIGGTGVTTGTAATNAFKRIANETSDVRDNIFVNNRSNSTGTGKHYLMNVAATTTLTSDFNDFFFNGTGAVFGVVNTTDSATFANWKTNTSKDTNSIFADPQFANPTANSTDVNLHVLSTSPASNAGTNIAAVTNDFDNQTRANPPDIGADEINGDTFQFSSASYPVNEAAGTVTITVTRAGDATSATSVNYATSDGTAIAGSDYTATSGSLPFAAFQTTNSFTVPIINDTLYEGSTAETFNVTLSGATTGTPNPATVNIVDNDNAPTISIGNVTVSEGGGNAVFTVTQSAASGLNTTFTYSTGNVTAIAGSDYTGATNVAGSITAGNTTTTISIPITDDSIYEGTETFTVTLSSPTNATIASGTGTGTITDNETAPTISINSVTVSEGAGNAVFTVTQSVASAFSTTFTYSTANGSAVAPGDYTAANNVAGSITAGNTTTTISIPVIQDALTEGSEDFTVTLSNAVNATIATGTGTGTITDDDLTFNASGNLAAGTYDNITINSPAVVTLTGNITVNGCITVNSGGTLLMGTFIISGTGCFTVNAGGTLGVGSVNGITTSGASGNVQVTGTRTYTVGANYIYNGTSAQVTGNALANAPNNLTIDNPTSVTSSITGLTVTGLLRVMQGTFNSASNYNNVQIDSGATFVAASSETINVSGNWTNNGGTFTAGTSTVNFNSTAATQTIGGTSASQTFNILTVSKSGQTLNTGGSLATLNVATFNVNAGTFDQGATDVFSGPLTVAAAGTYQGLSTGDLTLSGDVSNAGTITLNANGATCGDTDDILIRSSSVGVQRSWSGAGTFNMTDVDVKDQKAPLLLPPPVAIVVTSGTNSGNNTGWAFSGTCTAGTYTWIGGINADWQVATNWSPIRTLPSTGDVLILDGNSTPGPIITNVPTQTIAALRLINGVIATLNASALGAQTLTVSGATGMDLTIPATEQLTLAGANGLTINVASGSTATIGGLFIMQDGPHRLIGNTAGAITFQSGSICTMAPNYAATVNPFGTGGGGVNGATGSVIFASGSNYFHNNGESPFGIVANPPVAVFQTGSIFRQFSNNGFQGRTYSTLIVGDGTTPLTITSTSSDPFEFDSLTVNSSNTANTSLTVSVGGNVNIKGDISSAGNGNGAAVPDVTLLSSTGIVIAKTPAGTINFSNSAGSNRTVKFGSATAGSGNATVNTGNTLALGRKLVVDTNSAITVVGALTGSATGYVIGKEKRAYTGAELFIYHVGTDSGYAPLDANITAGTGDLTVEGKQPQQPLLTAATSLQRYWTLTEGGAITADLTFHYNQADVAGNEANYRVVVVEGGNATQFPESCPSVACVEESLNEIRRSGVQTFSDWTAAEPNAPTAVKLTGFTALENNGQVMLQWQSGYEVNNLGYNIYREEDGKRVQITPSLVAGSALIAGQQTRLTAGLSYTWFDEGGEKAAGRRQKAESASQSRVNYWLEDVDLDGTRTLHGPIAVAQCLSVNADCKQMAERSQLLGEVTKQQSAISNQQSGRGVQISGWPVASPETAADSVRNPIDVQRQIAGLPGVKISVSRAGWYRITQPEIVAAGLDVADSKYLQLYRDGRPVALRFSDWKDEFMEDGYLEFYGEGSNSTTDKAQTYYLVKSNEVGKRTPVIGSAQLGEPSGPQSFPYTVERKERMVYFSGLLNGDGENFFGQILSGAPTTATVPVNQLDPAPNAGAQLEVVLQGVTNQNHLVQVRFNGSDIGTLNFAGTAHPSQSFDVPAAALQEGNNSVELTAVGGGADISLVDSLRLTYQRTYNAANGALIFSVNSNETKRISGFNDDRIRILDITDPASVVELKALVSSDGDGFVADVQVPASENSPHSLVAVSEGQAAHVDGLALNQPSSWWSQTAGADYLIITPRDLMNSVEPLALLHRGQGMVVHVVDVEDVYDEFSFGEHSPRAIHDFVERATTTWTRQPHYLLLAGDASYDPKNYFGNGSNDLVPTKLIDTSLQETASDDWLADFNNDGIADLAVGRLPARTVAQVDTMVGKIIAYESAAPDPSRGALLVADRSFEASSTAVSSLLPSGMTVATINRSAADDATIHNQIIAAINQGPLVTNYVGHGSNGVWTGASLLSNNDAPGLTNTARLSVFTMMTCFNGYFQDAQNDSLSEALLKSQGGAVAVWASTTLTDPAGQNVIDQEFYRLLFGAPGATLGDAARAAKVTTTDADVRRTWTLFGDPAMRLR